MEKPPYNVLDVAVYIVNYCNEKNYDIINLQLHPLLFLTQAYSIAKLGKRCFWNNMEYWDSGVTSPEVFSSFRKYANGLISQIPHYLKWEYNEIYKKNELKFNFFDINLIEPIFRLIIQDIVDIFGKWSWLRLVNLCRKVRCKYDKENIVIQDVEFKDFFNINLKVDLNILN